MKYVVWSRIKNNYFQVPVEVLQLLSSNKRLYNVILENYPSLLSCKSTSDKGLNKAMEDVSPTPVTFSMKLKRTNAFQHQVGLVQTEEKFAQSYIHIRPLPLHFITTPSNKGNVK